MQIPPEVKTRTELQWDRIIQAVRAHCYGPWNETLEIPFAPDFESMKLANLETQEFSRFIQVHENLPLHGITDITPLLQRVEKKGVLSGSQLQEIQKIVAVCRALRQLFAEHKETFTSIRSQCRFSPHLDKLEESLSWALDEHGELSSKAFPEIKRLREQITIARDRIIRRLEKMLLKHESIVQDRYHTLREGRFVLPIRAEAQGKIQGLVHGTSDSGATVFLEPESLIELGNTLKMLQSELQQEENRVLDDLSHEVLFLSGDLKKALVTLKHIDLRQACARFGIQLGAASLTLSSEPVLDLKGAKHPLLLLEKIDTVANDLKLKSGQALVLSGPNAGGKTVLLKTAGLCALMTRAGIPFPCEEGSTCGFFDFVMTEIGDGQSIQSHLSSFSAHIQSVSQILRYASPQSLVLFDELAGNTDPSEGAALACAVVNHLVQKKSAVMVTTHYNALKALAEGNQNIQNASMGFDLDELKPTYKIRMGLAGTSSALTMAKRFGLQEEILQQAKQFLPEQALAFEKLVHAVEQKSHTLEQSLETAQQAESKATRYLEQVEANLSERRRRAKNAIQKEKEETTQVMRQMRAQLKALTKDLKTQSNQEGLEAARKKFKEIQKGFTVEETKTEEMQSPQINSSKILDASHWQVGDHVWVKSIRNEATILEISGSKAKVAAGPLKIWVQYTDLSLTRQQETKPKVATTSISSLTQEVQKHTESFRDNTIDVRGLSVEEALTLAESFADRMYGQDQKCAYILHGIGEGILRDAIRKELPSRSPVVTFAESAQVEKGGDKLTLIYLK